MSAHQAASSTFLEGVTHRTADAARQPVARGKLRGNRLHDRSIAKIDLDSRHRGYRVARAGHRKPSCVLARQQWKRRLLPAWYLFSQWRQMGMQSQKLQRRQLPTLINQRPARNLSCALRRFILEKSYAYDCSNAGLLCVNLDARQGATGVVRTKLRHLVQENIWGLGRRTVHRAISMFAICRPQVRVGGLCQCAIRRVLRQP